MLNATFDEVVEGRLNRVLLLSATKYSRAFNWIDEPCKNKGDSYWIEDRKRSANDQFCIRVGFASGMVDQATGVAFEAWARSIISAGIKYSPEMPFVLVTRYTPYDYLQMGVRVNGEPYGIARSRRPERQFNDWNPISLSQQPDRAAFYEALKNWAPVYAAAVTRAFDGDEGLTSRDFGEPQLPKR